MNLVHSELLNQIDELNKLAKRAAIDAYEIDAKCEEGFEVTARMGDVENLVHHRGKALTVTVYKDQRSGSASTSDLSLKALQESLHKACTLANYAEPDPFAGLPNKALMAFNYPDLKLYHPWDISPEKAIGLAIECDETARQLDKRITQIEEAQVYTHHYFRVHANSNDFIGHYASSFHGLSIGVVAQENGQMERDHELTHSRVPQELDSPKVVAKHAVERTLARLGARKISTRRCPVIFEKRVAKSLWRSFINAISGSQLYRQQSFLLDSIGTSVFPNFINIEQKPHIISGFGSVPFDSEGVMTKDLTYVKEGTVNSYVLGHYSAQKLGLTTTGNAGGVHNLLISHTEKNLAELCETMQSGLLVTELLGQGVNLLTGDYSRGASGFWVEKGVIQFPVHEITLSGNLRDMLKNIIAVGNDIDIHSNIQSGSVLVNEMVIAGD